MDEMIGRVKFKGKIRDHSKNRNVTKLNGGAKIQNCVKLKWIKILILLLCLEKRGI